MGYYFLLQGIFPTHVSCAGGWVLYLSATWEAQASMWNTDKGPG